VAGAGVPGVADDVAVAAADVLGASERVTAIIAITTIAITTKITPMITFRLSMIFPQVILRRHNRQQASAGCNPLYGVDERVLGGVSGGTLSANASRAVAKVGNLSRSSSTTKLVLNVTLHCIPSN
jgi:hypothetical protein